MTEAVKDKHRKAKTLDHFSDLSQIISYAIAVRDVKLKLLLKASYNEGYRLQRVTKSKKDWNWMMRFYQNYVYSRCCKAFDIYGKEQEDLKSPSQAGRYLEPRRVIIYFFLQQPLNFSLAKAAGIFNRDHATALNAKRRVNEIMTTDKNYRMKIDCLQKEFNYLKNRLILITNK